MKIDYLKDFVVLADTENYLEASETLFISQSSLSKHIKALETELGVSLFERTTRQVKLNDYGRTFLDYAKQIVQLQYQYTTAIMNQSNHVMHSLTIASIPIMAPYGITDAIAKFNGENKNVTVHLIEGESKQSKELLRQEQCELAFIREANDTDEEFAKVPYTTDNLAAILPIGHPLASEKELYLEYLREENFLLLRPGYVLNDICIDACKKAGFYPKIAYTGQQAGNIIDLVGKGMGISLLMKKPILSLRDDKVAIVDVIPTLSTQIKLYYKKKTILSTAAMHFINSIL